MLTLKLYKYSSKNNVVSKVLDDSTAQTLNGVFYEYYDTITPQIKARANANLNDLQKFNYCFIAELDNKYYFVENVVILSNDVFRFDLRLDVLNTYKTQILAATATVTTKENANGYISNRETVYNVLPSIEKINFSENTPFDADGKIIMVTLKGKV